MVTTSDIAGLNDMSQPALLHYKQMSEIKQLSRGKTCLDS